MTNNYSFLQIKAFKYWNLFLHENQCHLGRVYLLAKRLEAVDFIATTKSERDEFFAIAENINRALKNLFDPDLMNYASLGNRFKRLHVHFIPRYKDKRVFNDILFMDKLWGMNYAPYDKDFTLDRSCLIAIKDAVKKELNKCIS